MELSFNKREILERLINNREDFDRARVRPTAPGGAVMTPWEQKAHDIIAKYCHASWLQANTPNAATKRMLQMDPKARLYKRHRPYAVPAIADALVKALALPDSKVREQEIKRLFEVEQLGAWSLI